MTILQQFQKTITEVLNTETPSSSIVARAAKFARNQHAGQKRKFSNEPYFVHPERVAAIVRQFTNDNNMIAAAYLHDTVEDTGTTIGELDRAFNSVVADLVDELTSKTFDTDKATYLTNKMAKMSDKAFTIKLADRLQNVTSILDTNAPESFAKKYWIETNKIFGRLNTMRKYSADQQKLVDRIMDKLAVIQHKFNLS